MEADSCAEALPEAATMSVLAAQPCSECTHLWPFLRQTYLLYITYVWTRSKCAQCRIFTRESFCTGDSLLHQTGVATATASSVHRLNGNSKLYCNVRAHLSGGARTCDSFYQMRIAQRPCSCSCKSLCVFVLVLSVRQTHVSGRRCLAR